MTIYWDSDTLWDYLAIELGAGALAHLVDHGTFRAALYRLLHDEALVNAVILDGHVRGAAEAAHVWGARTSVLREIICVIY